MKSQPEPQTAPSGKTGEIVGLVTRFAIASQLFRTRSETRLAPQGLTLSQLSVLSHLARRGQPQRVTDIARAVEVGQPAVTKMLAKFEDAGWVRWTAPGNDKRSKMAEVTPEGRNHLNAVQRQLFPDLVAFFHDWSDAEITRFTQDLTRFAAFLDQNR